MVLDMLVAAALTLPSCAGPDESSTGEGSTPDPRKEDLVHVCHGGEFENIML